MGKQLRFFISERSNVDILANRIIESGFEVIKDKRNDNGQLMFYSEPAVLKDFSAPWFKIKLHKPEYGEVKTLFSPHIEWLYRTVNEDSKKIGCSRIYLNTSDYSKYDEQLCDLLTSDYKEICKSVKKIAPICELKDLSIKQRMDNLTVKLLNDGYTLFF